VTGPLFSLNLFNKSVANFSALSRFFVIGHTRSRVVTRLVAAQGEIEERSGSVQEENVQLGLATSKRFFATRSPPFSGQSSYL
jgi:hypothetical protein